MTEPMTFESLQSTANGLTHARDTRHGDGRREPAPENRGMGLYESSLGSRLSKKAEKLSGSKFELVYSTGGHGGPYGSQREAKMRAEKLLKGGKDKWIAIIKAGDVTNLKKAKPVALLTRKGWERGSSHLPNVPASQQEGVELDEAASDDENKILAKLKTRPAAKIDAEWAHHTLGIPMRDAVKAVNSLRKAGSIKPVKHGHGEGPSVKFVLAESAPACVQRAMTEGKGKKLSSKDEAKWRALGAKAFKRGLKSVPFKDKAVRDAVEAGSGEIGSSIPLMDAWSKGWHQANMAKTEEDGPPTCVQRALEEAMGDGTVKTFLHILRANLTQEDKRRAKADTKRGIPINIHALALGLQAAEKVEKAVKADLASDDIRALDRLKAAIGREFNPGGAAGKTLKAIDKFRVDRRPPKYPAGKR